MQYMEKSVFGLRLHCRFINHTTLALVCQPFLNGFGLCILCDSLIILFIHMIQQGNCLVQLND